MVHEPNSQSDGAAKTAETDTRGGVGLAVRGSSRGGGAGRTGALAFTTVGGRRFLLTLVSGAGTFVLALLGKIDATAYTMTTIGIVGAYIAGNTTQKVKGAGAE
jgi:predicted small integral membrane protein